MSQRSAGACGHRHRPFDEKISGAGHRTGDFVVLQGISLTVDEGKFVSIVGPSGCGKSTLLNVIAGIEIL